MGAVKPDDDPESTEWREVFCFFPKKDRYGRPLPAGPLMRRRFPNGRKEFRALTRDELDRMAW